MWGERDIPEWNAAISVSIMMFINLFFIGLLLQYAGLVVIIGGVEPVPKKIIIFIFLVFLGINYFLFIDSEKYKLIVKECEKENTKKRKNNTILLWLYVILSILFSILLIILIKDKYYS